MTATPKPPAHLSADAKRFWRDVADRFEMVSHDFRRLQVACEAWDTLTEARKVLKKDGMFFTDRYGNPRKHPAISVVEQSRIAFLRAVRELGLDVIESTLETRPPRIGGKTR